VSDFSVGDLVVCIADDAGWIDAGNWAASAGPAKGQMLTIASVRPGDGLFRRFVFLTFEDAFRGEGYAAHHFRPVRKTDISPLRALVAPRPKVDA
jgi:hypothetical protein